MRRVGAGSVRAVAPDHGSTPDHTNELTFRAEDGVEAELTTKQEPLTMLTNRTWVVATAVAEPDTAAAPSQELLDCWVGTRITFTKSSGRSGPASMTAPSGCTLIDLSPYDGWSDNPVGSVMELRRGDGGYPLRFRPAYRSGEIVAAFSFDLNGDGIAEPETSAQVTLREP